MEVFLLAAGLGTRLRPLTNNRPKALVEVNGHSLLELNINNLISQGATRIVINIHHFGEQIIDFINNRKWDTEIIISDERNLLLDTGGGLKHAMDLFSKKNPILIHNVDILSYIDLKDLMLQHSHSKSIATLAVSNRTTSRYLLFNNQNQLIGWHNAKTGEYRWSNQPTNTYISHAFSGIAVIEPELLQLLPEEKPYPIIPEYLKIAKNHIINCIEHNPADWLDVGKPETLKQAEQWYKI